MEESSLLDMVTKIKLDTASLVNLLCHSVGVGELEDNAKRYLFNYEDKYKRDHKTCMDFKRAYDKFMEINDILTDIQGDLAYDRT